MAAAKFDTMWIDADGIVRVRIKKGIEDEDGNFIVAGYHRTSIQPGTDPDEQMDAVEMDLGNHGIKDVDPDIRDKMKGAVKQFHTKAVVKAFKDKIKEQLDGPAGQG